MRRVRELKNYFIVFYLFGQTAYIPLKTDYTKQLQIFSVILKICHLIFPIAHTVLFIYNRFEESAREKFDILIMQYLILCIFIFASYATYINFFHPNLSHKICELFAGVIHYSEYNCRTELQIDKLKKNFTRKFLINIIIEMATLLSRFLSKDVFLHPLEVISFTISWTISRITIFYIMLFIDLLECVLRSLNVKVKKTLRDTKQKKDAFTMFHHMKLIHYNLWKISKILNEQFGMQLLLLLLANGISIGNTMFRSFILWPSVYVTGK